MNRTRKMVCCIISARLYWSHWSCCCCADSYFPVLLSGLSALIFPHQADGSLVDCGRQGR